MFYVSSFSHENEGQEKKFETKKKCENISFETFQFVLKCKI